MNGLPTPRTTSGERGFSLIELLVVVALIVIMAAVALPNLIGYLRASTVRAAQAQIAAELQTARGKAVMKNVNTGVVFVVVDQDSYRWIIEDAPVTMGPLRHLPNGTRFRAGGGVNDRGLRYSRLGGWCDPGAAGCAALPAPAAVCSAAEMAQCGFNAGNYVVNAAATGSTIVVEQPLTGLFRTVLVSTGGRVMTAAR